MFGSGPVRGFAVTMGLGIAMSMFTAVSIVRAIMISIVRRRRLKVLRIEPLFGMKLIPEGTTIPFMRGRYVGIAVSALLSLASIGLFIAPGLNYGVDFKGGIQMEVVTAGPADLARLRAGLESLGLGEVALQEFAARRMSWFALSASQAARTRNPCRTGDSRQAGRDRAWSADRAHAGGRTEGEQ
jgi:SecD/SecF fusion protein